VVTRSPNSNATGASDNSGDGDPTTLRLLLLRNGYRPVPIIGPTVKTKSAGKRPPMTGWQDICATAGEAEVSRWIPEYPDSTNTGIQCGRTIGADIDVRIPVVTKQIVGVARTMLGDTPLERIGMAPKTLLCYRAEVPFRKIATARLIMPDGSEAQIEILAEGQQFVAYGIHPDTLHPYEWVQDGPDTVPWTDLPAVTEAQLIAFVAAAEAILRAAGGRTNTNARKF
jgi:putative DNA primase/helicase